MILKKWQVATLEKRKGGKTKRMILSLSLLVNFLSPFFYLFNNLDLDFLITPTQKKNY